MPSVPERHRGDLTEQSATRIPLADVEGVRWLPGSPTGVGALVLAGSSGRVDEARAEVLARHGVVAESIRWFGGRQQHDGPWEIPLELFLDRIDGLARTCDRVLVIGTSFGAEAALLSGALCPDVDAVVAFAPTDVVWAAVRRDGTVTSHWTLAGTPVPFVPFDPTWEPDTDPPAYVGLYEASREHHADRLGAARIPVERIPRLLLVAGGDDQVWPSLPMAHAIERHRRTHGLATVVISDPEAGHRAVLPGEPVVVAGSSMRRGGTEEADRRLGRAAWSHLARLL